MAATATIRTRGRTKGTVPLVPKDHRDGSIGPQKSKKDLDAGVKSFPSIYDFNNRSPFKITSMVLPS